MTSLREEDPTVKRALLLTYIGNDTNDIFDTLADTGMDYDTAIQRLTEHFSPTENKDMAIFDSRQVTQQSGESIDEFCRRLKEKSSLCGFHDEDNEIKTQIIHKTADSRLRRKALREQLSLKYNIKYGKTLEQSDVSARKLERIEKSEQSTNEARNEGQIKSKVKTFNTTTVEIDILISNHLGKTREINHNNSVHNRVEIAEEPIPIQEERPAVPQVEKNAITVAKSDIFQNTASPK